MGLIEAIIRWWQASRLMCDNCGEVPVPAPGDVCSDECAAEAAEWAYWHDKAA